MNLIDNGYSFPGIDRDADSYFEPYEKNGPEIYRYGFQTVPQMRELMKKRLSGLLNDEEINECVKTAFRNKPSAIQETYDGIDRQPVDFIYQM